MLAAMRAKAAVASAGSRLFGDDVLKGSPAKDRKNEVVQGEKSEVSTGARRDARPDAADHDRNRERQEEERQEKLARPAPDRHPGHQSPHDAEPDVGPRDAGGAGARGAPERERRG